MTDADLVNELRRLLPDPVLRIELYDFVHAVIDATVTHISSDEFSPSEPQPTLDTIRERVDRYDTAMQQPGQMSVIGCLYSDVPSQRTLWSATVEELARVAAAMDRQSGTKFTAWTQLAWYPALAALYACALGSLAGQHPETLAAVLAQLKEIRTDSWSEPILQRIGIDAVGLAGGQLYGKAKTPQSEFIVERLRRFSLGAIRDDILDDLYDELEYVIGLVKADQTLGSDLSGHILPDMTRMLWRRDIRFDKSEGLGGVARWVDGANGKAWLDAGLFEGSPERLKAVREQYDAALRDYARRMPF